MARLNLYEQQTALNTPRADASAFGGNTAGAVAQAGGAAFDLGVAIKRREDVIDRVQRLNEFDTYAQEALTAANDTEDIAKQSTVDAFSQGLRQRASEIMNQHGGTAASKAELRAQVENQVGQYIKSAKAAQVKAQQQFIGRAVDQRVNELAIKGSFDPTLMPALFEQFDADLSMYADAMSPEQAAAYKEAGRSAIATGTIDRMLQDGNWQGAKALLQSPEVNKFLDRNAARRFAIDTTVEERKVELDVKRREANVREITRLAGRNLTPEERQRAYDLDPEEKNLTVPQKIARYELVSGKPASQGVIDKMFNVDGANGSSGVFGNSLQGRALDYINKNAAAYAAGLLSPEDARTFEISAAEAYKEMKIVDPVTEEVRYHKPNAPAFVQEALSRGNRGGQSMAPGAPVGPGGPQPGQRVRLTLPDGRIVGEATVGPDGSWSIMDRGAASSASDVTPVPVTGGAGGGNQPPPEGEKTIWEMAEDMAGPGAALRAGVGDLPFGIGGMFEGGGETATNRAYVRTQVSRMIDALSINPRNPVALVEMIRKEIDVDPKMFGDPTAYRKRIEGVNRSLTETLMNETAAGSDPSLPVKTRRDALEVANTIRNFQQRLMPPMVKNRKELDALGLPSGSKFIDPKGTLRTIP